MEAPIRVIKVIGESMDDCADASIIGKEDKFTSIM